MLIRSFLILKIDPPAEQTREENLKQIGVMKALLYLETEFWENIITRKFTLPSAIRDNNSLVRLCGGRISSGTLTPLKKTRSNLRTKAIEPLF